MRIQVRGYVLLFSALMFTAITPIAYVLGNGINPIALMLLVSLAGTLISFALSFVKGTLHHVKTYFTTRNGAFAILSFGILAYTLLSLIFSYVTHYVNADLVAVVYRSWPLMLILMAPVLMRERMTKYDGLGVIIGFSSLAVTLVGGTAISIPEQYLPFVLLLLLGAFFDAFVSGVSKKYNYELTSSIFAYNAVSFTIFLPLALLTGSLSFSGFGASTALGVILLGAVQNVLLTFLFVASFRRVRTSIASNVFIVSPFFTMLLSALFLSTPIEPYYLVVAFGVAFGILIQHMQPRAANRVTKRRNLTIFDVTGTFLDNPNPEISRCITGDGRAFAIRINKSSFDEQLHSQIFKSRYCLAFTNDAPHQDAQGEEMRLIGRAMALKRGEAALIGMGDPDELEAAFDEFLRIQPGAVKQESTFKA
ncbi:MAG: DMT family transporter [Candidatus Micrarchaeota archaeon]|nr:DMT family transporter [Candidatus Micrarchaeota archaeon]